MKYICEHCRNQVTDSQYFCHECGSQFDNVNDKFTVDIWHVPYEVEELGNNKFSMENLFGMKGVDILKRKNGHGEAYGTFYDMFEVDVEEDTIIITLLPEILSMFEGDKKEALFDALRTIVDYYSDVGWEFLQSL